jgi:amidophosphoribosyltransferase
MLDRLDPKRIVVVSSAPQIRYPDCYGIDMAKLGDLVAFQAAIALLKETKQENIIDDVYDRCLANVASRYRSRATPTGRMARPRGGEPGEGHLRTLHRAAASATRSPSCSHRRSIRAEVRMVYQGIEGLRAACPQHTGDWYFTGDYPTPGGNRVVNRAFINWRQGKNVRAY